MTHYLTPNYVFDTIYDITPDFLHEHGVRGVLIDIDGTSASHRAPDPSEALCAYIAQLHKSGIRAVFLSNNRAERVGRFSDAMGVPWISRAYKPFGRGFRKGLALLELPAEQVAIIGDQVFTDTLGGNRLGALTCYVFSLDVAEFWIGVRARIEHLFVRHAPRHKSSGGKHGD